MTRPIEYTLSTNDLKDLEEWIHHPGWFIFAAMVEREWGAEGFGTKVADTIGKLSPTTEQLQLAVSQLQQATVTQREVQRIMTWPRKVLSEAKAKNVDKVAMMASMNRGGL